MKLNEHRWLADKKAILKAHKIKRRDRKGKGYEEIEKPKPNRKKKFFEIIV